MRTIGTYLLIVLLVGIIHISTFERAHAQSLSTGTLNLVNGQSASVSLTMPPTGVTAYALSLPPSIGSTGQVLTVSAINGQTASMAWSDAQFWALGGNTIVTAGTAPTQQFLGTSNAQDLVIASNGSERMRVRGMAGPTQGNVGIGTADPLATLDVNGNILLSNSGAPSMLRFAEGAADGSNVTTFKATTQTVDINYTLPPAPPSSDGQVLSATTGGAMAWANPIGGINKGVFTPLTANHMHNIPLGFDIVAGAVTLATVQGPPGTSIAMDITAIDYTNNTITIETSLPITPDHRVFWISINP